MKRITKGMVSHLNYMLKDQGAGFRYIYIDGSMHITINDASLWVESCIVNCTNDYFVYLETWFRDNYDIALDYNNDRSIIWAKSKRYDEEE